LEESESSCANNGAARNDEPEERYEVERSAKNEPNPLNHITLLDEWLTLYECPLDVGGG